MASSRAGVAAAVAAPGAVEVRQRLPRWHVRAELEELRIAGSSMMLQISCAWNAGTHGEDLVTGEEPWSGKSCSSGGA
jgi:hypothetical protein